MPVSQGGARGGGSKKKQKVTNKKFGRAEALFYKSGLEGNKNFLLRLGQKAGKTPEKRLPKNIGKKIQGAGYLVTHPTIYFSLPPKKNFLLGGFLWNGPVAWGGFLRYWSVKKNHCQKTIKRLESYKKKRKSKKPGAVWAGLITI